jgi:hypothetical protein
MSEHSYDDFDDVLPEEPNGELVHWMEPRPMSFGAGAVALAAASGFALGLATALAIVGLARLRADEA